MNTLTAPHDAALALGARGWPVFPVKHHDKLPLTPHGFKDASTDASTIDAWWGQWPAANIGLPTGRASRLVVVDVDPRHGGDDSLRGLERQYGSLPDTVQAITGGGGCHYLFLYPDDCDVRCSVGILGPGLDVKAEGGYIVVPPSIHPSGHSYSWEAAHHPDDVPLAPLPQWLLTKLTARAERTTAPQDAGRTIPDGQRNVTLYRIARGLKAKGLSREAVEAAVEAENAARCTPPLPVDELNVLLVHVWEQPDSATFSARASASEGEWPDIQPVTLDLLPVEPLPPAIIPVSFRGWIQDVADRMQCPPDFVAAPLIVMTSSIIGAGCGIRPKQNDDWTVTPNLWGAAVGRPSMMKTPAIGEALKPLDRLVAAGKQEYDAQIKTHLAETEVYKAQREAIQAEMRREAKEDRQSKMDALKKELAALAEPAPPVWRRYMTNDATIEKMAELQASNPRGLLLFRDELVGLFATWDKDGHEADRTFYMEGWNGDRAHTSDRIGRGTTHVANLCVSLFGGIQPARLMSYLHAAMRGGGNDGLVQRLQLLVYPDELPSWTLIDRPVHAVARQAAFDAIERLAAMDFRQYGAFAGEGQTPYFKFDQAAQGVFHDWLTDLEARLRAEQEPVLQEHLGKYRSLMPSLALVFHLLNLANAKGVTAGPVTRDCAMQAAAWVDYLETHARRVYGLVTNVGAQAAANLAKRLTKGDLVQPFTARDVYRKCWSLLDDCKIVEQACDELVSLGWLRERVTPSAPGQRGKVEYLVNPKVRG